MASTQQKIAKLRQQAANDRAKKVAYQWQGYAPPVDAEVAFRALAEIDERTEGAVTAGAVVDAARSNDSPLHKAFEWDDGEAAEAFRRQQAMRLIRALVIVPVKRVQTGGTVEYRPVPSEAVHARTRDPGTGCYVLTSTLVRDAGGYARALDAARGDLAKAEHSLRQLVRAAEQSDGDSDPERPRNAAAHVRDAIAQIS